MTKYGFVIDHRRCIGCHACTVACKAENLVPVGKFRTWVKYIEKGEFPHTRRYFTVERCQHCEDAPCVEICPTVALYKRRDGIVDFDPARCIGCKACMQACPYDALYIDPETNTAAKCHYCAHRTDRGLLPACVIVCPTKAIIAGDLEDPASEIARTVAREQVQVRRPDQGTRPQVFYVGADEMIITPGLAAQPSMYMWSQVGPGDVALEPKGALFGAPGTPRSAAQATAERGRADGPGGGGRVVLSDSGQLQLEPHDQSTTKAVTVYDVPHPKPWGWKVASYLWTKSIGAGVLAVAGPLLATGLVAGQAISLGAAFISLLFIFLTSVLLVWDLKRPERFWRVVLTPNLRSWLPWGAYILSAFSLAGGLWFLAELLGQRGIVWILLWPTVLLGLATAGYSAFLFGQAEGRDFWQSPLLLPHLLGAAVLAAPGAPGRRALHPWGRPGGAILHPRQQRRRRRRPLDDARAAGGLVLGRLRAGRRRAPRRPPGGRPRGRPAARVRRGRRGRRARWAMVLRGRLGPCRAVRRDELRP
jgi:Fe-S-cluster-containing dehydrogenase component